jgi:cell fate (sporulation/competence/biofilm development) regulator YlbF (YheA/YmcA/DUF963 family)
MRKKEQPSNLRSLILEIETLKKELQEERRKREVFESLIAAKLEQLLKKLEDDDEVSSLKRKIQDLETRLEKEVELRTKLTLWIKENIGPNLEHIQTLIKSTPMPAVPKQSSVPTPLTDSPAPSQTNTKTSNAQGITLSTDNSSTTRDAAATSVKGHSSSQQKRQIAKRSHKNSATDSKQQRPPKISEDELILCDDEDSPWDQSDGEDDPSLTLEHFLPKVRPRLLARNEKLRKLESLCFGEKDIEDTELPVHDAVYKTSLIRANYFLNKCQQAKSVYHCPDLYLRVQEFQSKGGTVIFAPQSPEDLSRDNFCLSVRPHDRILPVCADGLHQSQILYLVLKGLKRVLGVREGICLPHGALGGYDPFILEQKSSNVKALEYVHITPEEDRNSLSFKVFFNAFGLEKVPRFGQKECGNVNLNLNEEVRKNVWNTQIEFIKKTRAKMKDFFDVYYYQQRADIAKKVRVIFVVFEVALPIVLRRLLDVNIVPSALTNVIVVAFPFGRETFTSPNPTDYINLYKFYASLFRPQLA